jgi:hypothetical protein
MKRVYVVIGVLAAVWLGAYLYWGYTRNIPLW